MDKTGSFYCSNFNIYLMNPDAMILFLLGCMQIMVGCNVYTVWIQDKKRAAKYVSYFNFFAAIVCFIGTIIII